MVSQLARILFVPPSPCTPTLITMTSIPTQQLATQTEFNHDCNLVQTEAKDLLTFDNSSISIT